MVTVNETNREPDGTFATLEADDATVNNAPTNSNDVARQADLHNRYTDSEARTAVEGNVDAANLTGASGTAGQVLETDGTGAAWNNLESAVIGHSNLSNTTVYTGRTFDSTLITVFNVTSDQKILSGWFSADEPTDIILKYTDGDGNTTNITQNYVTNDANDFFGFATSPIVSGIQKLEAEAADGSAPIWGYTVVTI